MEKWCNLLILFFTTLGEWTHLREWSEIFHRKRPRKGVGRYKTLRKELLKLNARVGNSGWPEGICKHRMTQWRAWKAAGDHTLEENEGMPMILYIFFCFKFCKVSLAFTEPLTISLLISESTLASRTKGRLV